MIRTSHGKYYQIIINELGDDYLTDGSVELRYQCENCQKLGRTYDDYKLYVNSDNLLFDCKRCGWQGKFNLLRDLNSSVSSQLEMNISTLASSQDSNSDDARTQDTYYRLPSVVPGLNDPAVQYMMSRGFSYEKVLKYNMRVATDEDSGRFSGRIVIPNRIIHGKWTDMYVGRSYLDHLEPKYLNPPESPKNNLLYNLHNIPENPDYIIIFEGVLEVITHDGYGVATYGKSISRQQIELIKKKNPKNILLCWDYDANEGMYEDATQYKTDSALSRLSKYCEGSKVWWVVMPPGVDASDEGEEVFNSKINDRSFLYENEASHKMAVKLVSAKIALEERRGRSYVIS